MASSKEYLDFILEQLSELEEITYRSMMGEYIIYYHGKIVKEPQGLFWGRYQAYFSDLDGYYWEVAWGPGFKYDENGLLKF